MKTEQTKFEAICELIGFIVIIIAIAMSIFCISSFLALVVRALIKYISQ